MTLLKVENLRVYYQTLRGEVKAVDNVSFSITPGEIMGLAGESGCGKSTLGRSLVLLKPPMKYIGGNVLLEKSPLPIWDQKLMAAFRFSGISLIPQYALSALNPTRKIKKILVDILHSKGVKLGQIFSELCRRMELVELPFEVLNMYPFELSGGMKQRMVMVLSTLLNPSLLIADEVTSALDVSTQKAVAKMLVEFRDRQFVGAIIVITHDISLLYQIADSIFVMYAGKLMERGSTEDLIRRPKHPYTQLLVASLPKIGLRYGQEKLQGIPGVPPSLLEPPPGCRFRTRCPRAWKKCWEDPPLVTVEDGGSTRQVACWLAVDKHA